MPFSFEELEMRLKRQRQAIERQRLETRRLRKKLHEILARLKRIDEQHRLQAATEASADDPEPLYSL